MLVCTEAGLLLEEKGIFHLAYDKQEWQMGNEFMDADKTIRPVSILNARECLVKSRAVNAKNLKEVLYSTDEMIVEAGEAIEKLPAFLQRTYNMHFYFNKAVNAFPEPVCRQPSH